MGEFLDKYFVSSYQQAGDFQVVQVNGNVRKNGGNVASYFCTPHGQVIHAVGGPVSADRLLREAEWAVATYEQAMAAASSSNIRTRNVQMAESVQAAHLEKLRTDRATFEQRVQTEVPRVREEFAKRSSRYGQSSSAAERLPMYPTARLRAARRFSGERAHQLLAAFPLAAYREVSPVIFETLTNERITLQRGPLFATAESLNRARERGLPSILVVYRGTGARQSEFDMDVHRRIATLFRQRPLAQVTRGYNVGYVPQRQLAALSSLVEMPVYEMPARSRLTFLLLDPYGYQVAAVCGSTPPDQLAERLWPPLQQSRLARGQALAAEGKHADALRLMRGILLTPSCPTTRQTVQAEIDRVVQERRELAQQPSKDGTLLALREQKNG